MVPPVAWTGLETPVLISAPIKDTDVMLTTPS